MAARKWSTLTQGSALTGPEIMRMVQGGLDRYVTPDMIVTYLGASSIKTPGKFRRTGTYETQAYSGAVASTYTMGQDSIRAFPWLIQDAITFTEIKTRVSTAVASGKYRIGIYTNTTGTNYPGTLIAGSDAAEYDASSTGTKSSGAINITLQPGWYWVANNSNSSTIVLDGFESRSSPPMTVTDIVANVFTPNRWLIASTYGALPSTFPGSAALSGSAYPAVGFKV